MEMEPMRAIVELSDRTGITRVKASKAMGKTDAYIANAVAKGSRPRVDVYARMVEAFGYGLYLMPPEDAPESAIRVDASEQPG